jgi:hypothetical protein
MKMLLITRIAVTFTLFVSPTVCFMSNVHAAGTVARASSEPSVDRLTPEEYWDHQQELHE